MFQKRRKKENGDFICFFPPDLVELIRTKEKQNFEKLQEQESVLNLDNLSRKSGL